MCRNFGPKIFQAIFSPATYRPVFCSFQERASNSFNNAVKLCSDQVDKAQRDLQSRRARMTELVTTLENQVGYISPPQN